MPDLDERAGNGRAVLIEHARTDMDELAERPAHAVPREVAAHGREPPLEPARPAELGGSRGANRERLRRPAQRGLCVARYHAFGLRARRARIDPVSHVNHISMARVSTIASMKRRSRSGMWRWVGNTTEIGIGGGR